MKKQLYFSQPDSENWTWPVTAKTYAGLSRKVVIKNGLPSIEVKKRNAFTILKMVEAASCAIALVAAAFCIILLVVIIGLGVIGL